MAISHQQSNKLRCSKADVEYNNVAVVVGAMKTAATMVVVVVVGGGITCGSNKKQWYATDGDRTKHLSAAEGVSLKHAKQQCVEKRKSS